MTFVTSLSREAQGVDFRVIAPSGGYERVVKDVVRQLSYPQSTSATFEITAQHNYDRAFLRITVARENFSIDGRAFRFDGSIGEFLDFDGHGTGNFVSVLLGIDPTITQEGQTVGVLRMEEFVQMTPPS